MEYAKPRFSHEEVDAAGDTLIDPDASPEEYDRSLDITNNWRASHNLPLLLMRIWLARLAKKIEPRCIVAQRIKRLETIKLKLKRLPRLKLSELQDIGGCRAVVQNVKRVEQIVSFYNESRSKHKRDREKEKNYIISPKKDGYRSIHLIYRFQSEQHHFNNGLRIEIQLRTKLQHAWATAVETVSIFTREALKFSGGSETWRRFFALMGTAIAMKEKSPLVPNTPTNKRDLVKELKSCAEILDVTSKLDIYGAMPSVPSRPHFRKAQYFILVLNSIKKTINIIDFKKGQLEEASKKYLEIEQSLAKIPESQAVLVSAESLLLIRRAFPNFFLDMRTFIREVNNILAYK